jgi:hypothetical protein
MNLGMASPAEAISPAFDILGQHIVVLTVQTDRLRVDVMKAVGSSQFAQGADWTFGHWIPFVREKEKGHDHEACD